MKKLVCSNCGSNDVSIELTYASCNHCKTKFHLPSSYNEKKHVSHRKIIYLLFTITILFFSGLGAYFWNNNGENNIIIDNSNSQIGTQSVVINHYNNIALKDKKKEMKFWNVIYKKLSRINSLVPTKLNSYLIYGENEDGGYISEVDRNGKEIWGKTLPVGFETDAIRVDGGYIVSYEVSQEGVKPKREGETMMLNNNQKTVFTFPALFHSMVPSDQGFIGVSYRDIKHVDLKGNVIWEKSLERKHLEYSENKIVKLKDNNIVEAGRDKNNIFWLTKYSQNGDILWQKKSSVYQFYLEKLIATSDGGFILLAGRYMKIHKYNDKGELEWRSTIPRYVNTSSLIFDAIEAMDGYIISATVDQKLLIAKLDFDGNVLWDKVYKSNKRLKPHNIVKAFDGGYLLSVDKCLSAPWLVKMNERGKIETDFNSSNYQSIENTTLIYKSNRTREDKYLTRFLKTYGNTQQVEISKNEMYAYASSSGGFHIFDLNGNEHPKSISRFSKSKTKIVRYPNGSIGPSGIAVKDMKGDYDYNLITKFIISKNEKKAFILDENHGFYLLDISVPKSPKLIMDIKEVKGLSMTLSADQRHVYIPKVSMNRFEVTEIDIVTKKRFTHVIKNRDLNTQKPLIYSNDVARVTEIVELPSSQQLLVSYNRFLFLYDIRLKRVIEKYERRGIISSMVLTATSSKVYISTLGASGIGGTEIFSVEKKRFLKHLNIGRVSYCIPSKDETKLYTASSEGVKVINISDINDPIVNTYYRGVANHITLSANEKRAYMAFSRGIGIVHLE